MNLKARKYWQQVKEIKLKLIIYNLGLAVKILFLVVVVEEFYRAPPSSRVLQTMRSR